MESNTPSAVWQQSVSQSHRSRVKHAISNMTDISQSLKGGVKHVISNMATVSQPHRGGVKHVISSMANAVSSMATVSQSVPKRWSETRHQLYGNNQSISPKEVESNTPSAV